MISSVTANSLGTDDLCIVLWCFDVQVEDLSVLHLDLALGHRVGVDGCLHLESSAGHVGIHTHLTVDLHRCTVNNNMYVFYNYYYV